MSTMCPVRLAVHHSLLQVKAVLTAALYPNVAVMDDAGGPNARPAWHDGQGTVAIHPSSINHPLITTQYMRPYLVYLEKVRSMLPPPSPPFPP